MKDAVSVLLERAKIKAKLHYFVGFEVLTAASKKSADAGNKLS
jgi:hypothetical protein